MRAFVGILLLIAAIGAVLPAAPAAAAAAQAVGACSERIVNGGFESGVTGWEVVTNGPFALVGPALPHAGAAGAILGARNNADDRLEQSVTLPAGQFVTLRFWWQMLTDETDHPWDTLEITVRPAGSPQSVRLLRLTDGNVPGRWQQAILGLDAYAGQTVELSFRAQTDANRPTEFYVDDVSVQACDAPAFPVRILLPQVMR